VVSEIFIRYETTTGLEKVARFDITETTINLDLRDMATIDLLPIIWCESLECINLRNNSLSEIDLSPLEKCGKSLKSVRLNNNRIQHLDLDPLSSCPNLEELNLERNRLKRVDLSPLFQCANLKELVMDRDVGLTASLLLRSVGSWPEVLVNLYHRILWKSDVVS
jgi:Leucine-rich repeat (LRR) protein